eukprot:gene3445-3941_t
MINQSGIPVDIIGGFIEPGVLVQRLENALKTNRADSVSNIDNKEIEAVDNGAASNSTCDHPKESTGKVEATTFQQTADKTEEDDSDDKMKRKIEHAKKQVELQRIKKEKLEKQEMIEREKKRRMDGRGIAMAKKQQAEREAKQIIEDQAKEKEEAKAAREAIRWKILQDKAEKAAKFESEKNEARNRRAKPQQEAKQEQQQPSERLSSRIQFRLPDGSVVTNEYPSSTTLGEIANSLITQINWPHGSMKLATIYPKKEFDNDDMERSIKELNLVPSAVIIVLPEKQQSKKSLANSNGVLDFIKFVLAPIISLLMYLKLIIFGSGNQDASASKKPDVGSSNSRQKQSEKPNQNQPAYKREGNVHRFKQDEKDDEDNNTWNGNSTQQM